MLGRTESGGYPILKGVKDIFTNVGSWVIICFVGAWVGAFLDFQNVKADVENVKTEIKSTAPVIKGNRRFFCKLVLKEFRDDKSTIKEVTEFCIL